MSDNRVALPDCALDIQGITYPHGRFYPGRLDLEKWMTAWVNGRSWVWGLWSACMMLACSGPTSSQAVDKRVDPFAGGAAVKLTLVALNDFHGALYEREAHDSTELVLGGLPWLVGAVDSLRAQDPDIIVLDGGDVFQGAWPVNATRGRGAVESYNLVGVDAAAIGNHEFDYGPTDDGTGHPLRGALEQGLRDARYAWLAANIADAEGGAPWRPEGLEAWTMIERKGIRVAVIGLSTTETPTTTRTELVADLRFLDVVETMRALLPEIEAAGADVVVVVGHLTGVCTPEPISELEIHPDCVLDGEIGRLLTELPPGSIDVIVSGHAHTLIAHRIDQTFVVENRSSGRAIGRVDLVVTANGVDLERSRVARPMPLLHTPVDPGCGDGTYDQTPQELGALGLVTPNAEALALIERLEAEAGSLCDEVGCSAATLRRDRKAESAVGNLVSDAMRDAFPDADVAFANGGGLRDDFPAGPLRREHVQAVMPFDNRLLLVELTGTQLTLMLRIGSSGRHSLLQVSGARYHLDPDRSTGTDLDNDGTVDTWELDRLCSSTVGGQPIDPAATYRVVITDFLYGGGDHLAPVFADVPVTAEGPLLRDALEDYIRKQSTCLGETELVVSDAPRIKQAVCK